MVPILMRCRDAEMMGPVCDVLSEEKPLTETIREMRVHAMTHNEPAITDTDVEEIEELMELNCCEQECECSCG